jgi:hypothetical protein
MIGSMRNIKVIERFKKLVLGRMSQRSQTALATELRSISGKCEKHVHLLKLKQWTETRVVQRKEDFNDSLPGSGVWLAGTPKAVTIGVFTPSTQVLPWFFFG